MKHFLEDIHVLFHKYKSDHVKNVLFGHSMGGLITHLYMIDYDDFDMSIVSAAPSNFISDVLILRLIGFRYFGFINKKMNFHMANCLMLNKLKTDI